MSKYEDFEIISQIGKGAFGTIWKVRNIKNKQIYAMKQYREDISNIDTIENAFELAMSLQHPNLMRCYTFFTDRIILAHEVFRERSSVHLFGILEYLEGESLYNIVNTSYKSNKIKEMQKKMSGYLPQAISGLKYLHSRNIIHRDIKAENLFITSEGTLKIIDYDFLINSYKAVKRQIGTPYYVSPEIYSQDSYNTTTDLWALGITIYFCLSGKYPFQARTVKELKALILSSYEPDLKTFPFKYQQIITGLLEKEPFNRMTLNQVLNLL